MTRSSTSHFPISAIESMTISRVPTIQRTLLRRVPAQEVKLADGNERVLVATVYDLFVANYGIDRGLGGEHIAQDYNENQPYTPAWAEQITGVPADHIITVARVSSRAMLRRPMAARWSSSGAGMNHWYHMDMNLSGDH